VFVRAAQVHLYNESMRRLMIIPAAGAGSRLKSPAPKLLVPVAGRPMIDYLFDLYKPFVERFIIVLHPSFAEDARRHCAGSRLDVEYAIQPSPTGMLDAILIPHGPVSQYQPDQVWITWCDQIAVTPGTARKLEQTADLDPTAAMVMPTFIKSQPYIHLVRNADGKIVDILHRREGDDMPELREGDLGLFSLSRKAYIELLPQFAGDVVKGHGTQERNFLPFISWLANKAPVVTFPAQHEIESVGVNDAADLRRIEQFFVKQ